MSEGLGSLSEEDVQRVALLIERLSESTFDFLQLEVGDLKVTIGKGDAVPAPAPNPTAPTASVVSVPRPALDQSPPPPAVPPAPAASPIQAATAEAASAVQDGTLAITTPILGIFYAQSEPGAAPFVTLGSEVTEDTTVALIEVMKTYNAVQAGVRGTIVEIAVENAQMVEFKQVLFRVRPHPGPSAPHSPA